MDWKVNTELYNEYEKHSNDNELEILVSKDCLCYGCGQVFSAREINSWGKKSGSLSAMCPKCGLMHIVGDGSGLKVDEEAAKELFSFREKNITKEELHHEYVDFCLAYFDGKIDDTETNEKLYMSYLEWLYRECEEPLACINLARAYARGLKFVPAEVETAIWYYRDDLLASDSQALYELGLLYDRRNAKGDGRRAFECFSKASALGSLSASLNIANYYMQGKYVARDELFGANAMYSIFGEMYTKAFNDPNSLPEFGTCAYNLGLCFQHGLGVKASTFRALRYYLIAEYAAKTIAGSGGPDMEWFDNDQESINKLLDGRGSQSPIVVYDEDTFYDTFAEQQDYYAEKTIARAEYVDEGRAFELDLTASRSYLAIDCGNACTELVKDTAWNFVGAKFELHPTERRYDRIEFVNEDVVRFVREDPLYGDLTVLTITFPPNPNQESGE